MKIIKTLKFNNKGYAVLFAVVVVSIISMIALGLSNSTYKQLVLSSLANDSQLSFFQSDTATECALYADNVLDMSSSLPPSWSCGKDLNGNDMSFSISGTGDNYTTFSSLSGQSIPCFDFEVVKADDGTGLIKTNIFARGYNSCNKLNPKTVEREIKVTY